MKFQSALILATALTAFSMNTYAKKSPKTEKSKRSPASAENFVGEDGLLFSKSDYFKDGILVKATWDEALKACPTGYHLPTIREVAEEKNKDAIKADSKCDLTYRDSVEGYMRVTSINQDGSYDCFYYKKDDKSGYDAYKAKHPSADVNNTWTASEAWEFGSESVAYTDYALNSSRSDNWVGSPAFAKDAFYDTAYSMTKSEKHAVRCVADKKK